MATRAVHWHEGMFLRPQHLQAAGRYEAYQRARGDKWDLHHNWGLRSLKINREALANHRLVIESLQARMRDGSLVSLPEDAPIPEYDLRGPLERNRDLKVFLALPSVRQHQPNIGGDGQEGGGRYAVDSQDIEDENTGMDPQPLQVRRLRVRFLLSNQEEHAGYEVLPIARIEKSAEADSIPRLDETTYIPPVLSCDAWAPLQVGILRNIYERIGTKIDLLAGQVQSRGIGIESHAFEDVRIVTQLRALNEAYTVLNVRAFADGVHPFEAYVDLCRLVGQLAIFDKDRRPPLDLPRYDHDDLKRFYRIKTYLDGYLNLIIEPDFERRDFKGVGLQMQVKLKPEWLETSRQMFVGVKSELPPDECYKLIKQLDMKIGSESRVDDMYKLGMQCLKFSPRAKPPSLPPSAGWTFFEVDREAAPEEWRFVQSSYTLAIRLNERRVEGTIDEKEELTFRHAGQNQTLRFSLYVIRAATPTGPARS
jgi:type VI secretion system protein ImpJ